MTQIVSNLSATVAELKREVIVQLPGKTVLLGRLSEGQAYKYELDSSKLKPNRTVTYIELF